MANITANAPSSLSLTGGSSQSFYLAFSVDADTGSNEAIINGLPSDTTVVNAWMTEDKDGKSHFGAINFQTKSVQLKGTTCRIFFTLHASADDHWPCGVMMTVS